MTITDRPDRKIADPVKVAQLAAIAAALGPEWRADYRPKEPGGYYEDHNHTITHAEGYGVHLVWPDVWKTHEAHRISISGIWPKSGKGDVCSPYQGAPSITLAQTKTAEQIAKDIRARFLPAYLPIWQQQKARADQHSQY
jgi:hypothetical protein